jgi:hypothetical protein
MNAVCQVVVSFSMRMTYDSLGISVRCNVLNNVLEYVLK